jgi:putative cell wall-binding protein
MEVRHFPGMMPTRGAAPGQETKPMPAVRRKAVPKAKRIARSKRRYWSDEVTRNSNALDLDSKVFTLDSPRAIAASLKRSAERSKRRKATPFQSAMSMLTFYLNRAGRSLPDRQRRILEQAKQELRKAFGKA